jgi:hypothetical protein
MSRDIVVKMDESSMWGYSVRGGYRWKKDDDGKGRVVKNVMETSIRGRRRRDKSAKL